MNAMKFAMFNSNGWYFVVSYFTDDLRALTVMFVTTNEAEAVKDYLHRIK